MSATSSPSSRRLPASASAGAGAARRREADTAATGAGALLDLFCGAGGASRGYAQAGLAVIGVDIAPQPEYQFDFIEADALSYLAGLISSGRAREFHMVHASPPCQAHSDLRNAWNAKRHADLIPATRALLERSGVPWVIENVPGAPLRDPVTLCGCMFGLGGGGYRLVRRRLFESSFPIPQPACRCASDPRPVVGVYGGKVRNRRAVEGGSQRSRVGTTLAAAAGQEAMGLPGMSRRGMSQAIPPAYALHVARAFLAQGKIRETE